MSDCHRWLIMERDKIKKSFRRSLNKEKFFEEDWYEVSPEELLIFDGILN